jgi:DNA repair ATPase RecN
VALATLDERDADIVSLSAEHRQALATIEERDEQIREFDQRLAKLGEEHSYALTIVRERDAQLAETLEQLHRREAELAWIKQRLETVSKIPGMGYLIQRLRKNAQG